VRAFEHLLEIALELREIKMAVAVYHRVRV
jgi:hypothetical protein